jgi:hypothetical protein
LAILRVSYALNFEPFFWVEAHVVNGTHLFLAREFIRTLAASAIIAKIFIRFRHDFDVGL